MDPDAKPLDPASSPPAEAETTPTVEAAFGKEAPKEPSEAPPSSAPPPPPPGAEPPNPEPAKPGADKRLRQFTARLKEKDSRISGLEAELAEYKGKAELTPDEAVDKRFAENELRREQAAFERERAEHAALLQAELAEAFPDEASRREFAELSGEYGVAIDRYAPRVSELVLGSEIKYRLADAFYSVLSGNPSALRDFLNMPYPVQKRQIKGLEAFLLSGGPASQSPPSVSLPASPPPPRSIVPSDSGASMSEPDPYEAVLAREEERNRRIHG